MKKILLCVLLSIVLIAGANTTTQAAMFKDVPTTSMFYEPIAWSQQMKLIQGHANGNFEPNGVLTEGQFVIIFARLIDPLYMTLAKKDWLVEREEAYNLLDYYDIQVDSARKNEPATRLFVAKILFSYTEGHTPGQNEAIRWMYDYQLTTGKGVSKDPYIDFGSHDQLKREHAATFMKRYFDNVYYPSLAYPTPQFLLGDYVVIDSNELDFDLDGNVDVLETYISLTPTNEPYYYFVLYKENPKTQQFDYVSSKKWMSGIYVESDIYEALEGTGSGTGYLTYTMEIDTEQEQPMKNYIYIHVENGKDIKINDHIVIPSNAEDWMMEGFLSFWQYNSLYRLYELQDGRLVEVPLRQFPVDEHEQEWRDTYYKIVQYDVDTEGNIVSSVKNGDVVYVESYQSLRFQQGDDNFFDHDVQIEVACLDYDCLVEDSNWLQVTIQSLENFSSRLVFNVYQELYY